MSTAIKTRLVCDFPDGDSEHPARWPIRVSLDGEEYEADACDSAARRLEREFAPFMRAARPARRVAAPQRKRTAGDRRRTYAIRTWALERDHAGAPDIQPRHQDRRSATQDRAQPGRQREPAQDPRAAAVGARRARGRRDTGSLRYLADRAAVGDRAHKPTTPAAAVVTLLTYAAMAYAVVRA